MFNIEVTPKSKFSFECNAKTLSAAISKAVAISSFGNSGDSEKHHFIIAHKKQLYVIGYSSETFICVEVGAEVSGNGAFGFVPQILNGLIKNRNDLKFTFDKHLTIKAAKGKYSANLNTLDVNDDHIPHIHRELRFKSKSSASSMSGPLLERVRQGIRLTDLKDYYNDEQILSAIRVRKNVLDISSHDNFHMAYFRTKVKAENDFELAIPVMTFKLLDKFISDEKEEADFFLDSKSLRITGKTYMVSLPPVQVDSDYFDRVPGYIKSLERPIAQLKFSGKAISTVDNMFTISEEESRLALSVSPKGTVSLSLSTENGKISDAFKTDVGKLDEKLDFMIDPRIFADLFGKTRDRKEVPMRLFSKRNKGVSSCFILDASAEQTKAYLVGTYYEE